MRCIRIEFCPGPVDAASAISDVRLAVALLIGAASKAEEALASLVVAGRAATHWEPEALAAARPLEKVIKASIELEAALAGRPAVNTAHLPSPATLKTIAAVEAARASMPSASTLAAIAAVEATRRPKG
jgi:hypothetical protein